MKALHLMRSRGPELAAAGAALLLRLWFLHHFADHPLFTPVAGGHDRTLYHAAAQAVAGGAWWPEGAFRYLPLYPWLLGLVYAGAGASLHTAAAFGVCCDALSAGLLVALARRLGARTVFATAAGLAYACHPLAIAYAPLTMPNTLNVLLVTTLAWALAVAPRNRTGPWVALGALAGVATLGFAGVPLMIVALLAWWRTPRGRVTAPTWPAQGAMLAAALLVLAPVAIHNSRAEGRFVLLTTHGGFNFYMGNHERATGHPVRVRDFRMTAREMLEDAHRAAELAEGHPLKDSESSAWWARQARAFWIDQPGPALRLLARKLLLAWNRDDVDDLRIVEQARLAGVGFAGACRPGFAVFGFLGLFGLLRARGAGESRALLAAGIAGLVVYFITARYRLTFVPLMAALGASALDAAWTDARAGRAWWKDALAAVSALAVVLLPMPTRDVRTTDYYNLAVQLQAAGRIEEALRTADEGLAIDTRSADLWHARGTALFRLQRHREAADAFAHSAELNPAHPQAAYNLGLSLARAEDYCGARAALEQAAQRRPLSPQAAALLRELQRICPHPQPGAPTP